MSTATATMQIPELWRFDGSKLGIWSRQAGGNYVPASSSRYFPAVSVAAISGCIVDMTALDDAARLGCFREWVRTLPAPAPKY